MAREEYVVEEINKQSARCVCVCVRACVRACVCDNCYCNTSSLAKQTLATNTVETTKIVNSDGEEEEISTVPSFQDAFGLSLSAAFENVRDASIGE